MSAQMLWIILAVFVLGLFIGSNLGIMILCLLNVAAQDSRAPEPMVLADAQS